MAFGSSLKKQTQSANEATKENKVFENPFVNDKAGRRVIRLLPVVNADGIPEKNENVETITETEVRFADYWLEVKNKDNPSGKMNLRVIVDWENPFDNVVWEHLSNEYPEKGDKRRKLARQRFAINVFDRTPVLFAPNGAVVYPNSDKKYMYEDSGKKVELTGDPVPLNRIKILEGSAGKPEGKHLLQNLVTTCDGVEDVDGRILAAHEYDIVFKITGVEMDTQRMFQLTSNKTPLSQAVLALQRWNIAEWATPWPEEMIKRLLNGEDFSVISQEYTFVRFPNKFQLFDVEDQELITPNE